MKNQNNTRAAQIAFIRNTYSKLTYVLGSQAYGQYPEQIYNTSLKEEKKHRQTWATQKYGISSADAAKLFVVRDLARYAFGLAAPLTITDVLDCKESAVLACAVATKYAHLIKTVFTDETAKQADALDYVELVG